MNSSLVIVSLVINEEVYVSTSVVDSPVVTVSPVTDDEVSVEDSDMSEKSLVNVVFSAPDVSAVVTSENVLAAEEGEERIVSVMISTVSFVPSVPAKIFC